MATTNTTPNHSLSTALLAATIPEPRLSALGRALRARAALPVPACVALPLLCLTPEQLRHLSTNTAVALLGLQLRPGHFAGTKDLLNAAGEVLVESARWHEVRAFLHADGYVECDETCCVEAERPSFADRDAGYDALCAPAYARWMRHVASGGRS